MWVDELKGKKRGRENEVYAWSRYVEGLGLTT